MKMPSVRTRKGTNAAMNSERAFSLVEVAMALGIVSFVLLALIGLFSVGLNAGKDSQLDTVQAAIVHRMLSEIRTTDFDTLAETNALYDYAGQTNSSLPYFECKATFSSPTGLDPVAASHLRRVRVEIRYPYGIAKQTTNVLHASLARQD